MKSRMTITDIATYTGLSRPSVYKVVEDKSFPPRGDDKCWDRDAVVEWLGKSLTLLLAVRS